MNNTIWLNSGRTLKQVDSSTQLIENLPNEIYTIQINPRTRELYLEKYADTFHFDFKIYNMESRFIDHVIKTFESTTGNLGILLNGMKGTGKTVTAKLIAKKLNLPIILITDAYEELTDFISKICCPCILFFDEYEKIFNKDSNDVGILSIMDGVFNNPYRRVFLLTTNNLHINDSLIGRPSRIRYKKTFGNLSSETIKEYINDNLKDKKYTNEIIKFIDSLAISTIDILKTIIEELNIHNVPIASFKNFFNVETAKYTWNIKYKVIRNDYDKDEEEGEYSVEKFKRDLGRTGKKEKSYSGEEYLVTNEHAGISTDRVSTSSNIIYMQVGSAFGTYGNIIRPVSRDGILVTEDEDGYKFFIKVTNIEYRPSLYRGELHY